MSSLTLLVTLTGIADVPYVAAPPDLERSLLLLEAPLDFAGSCADNHLPGLATEYGKRDRRYLDVTAQVTQLWGRSVDFWMPKGRKSYGRCSRSHVLSALADVDAGLNDVLARFSKATIRLQHGAWVGPLKLCRTTVLRAEVGRDTISDEASLSIDLMAPGAARLASLTKRMIGSPVAVRLEGEIIAKPMVHAVVTGGMLAISGPGDMVLGRVRVAATGDC